MKPRDIDLNRHLVATFGKAELEHAAMLLIALMAEGNEWTEVRRADLIEFARDRAPRSWMDGQPILSPGSRWPDGQGVCGVPAWRERR